MRFLSAPASSHKRRNKAWILFPLLLFLAGVCAALLLRDYHAALSVVLLSAGAAELAWLSWRRHVDAAANRYEEMVRISQRIARIGSWDWDLVSGTLDCSDEICSIFGLEPDRTPHSYPAYLALLPRDDREILAAAIREALGAADAGFAVEHRVVRPDGTERYLYEAGEVIHDGSGAAVRVVGVVHDITQRKEAEDALFFEKRYRALIENLPQRIFLKDRNSVYLSCNSSFARELGRVPEEIFGKTDHDLFQESLATKRMEDDARVMAAGFPVERDERRVRDGSWVSSSLVPLKDDSGQAYGLLGVLTDITRRKRAEEQLKESEERFRNTFEQAAVGIFHLAMNGVMIRVNPCFCDILGFTPTDLLGRTLDETVHPEDLAAEREQTAKLLAREIENYSMELRQLRKDGSLVWVNLTKSLLCGERGEPRYLAGVVEDITAKREAQALRRERDLVQAASRAKSQFLAGMSHEIRTPMNAIIGLGRLALQTQLTAKQREYLEKICSSGQTLLDIINDILDFSKIEAGRVELERTEFSLADVLATISDLFSVKAQEKGIAYRILLDPQLPARLLGDPLRLTQVLNNLVGNAVKFTEHGEVTVEVRMAQAKEDEVAVRFLVKDTGVGLSADQIGKIFTPFTQADSSTTRRYGGTGLGLSISTQLVELMGGELKVQSEQGTGSSFYFTVNFALQAAGERPEPAGETEPSLRMLVLDRDEDSRERLKVMVDGLPLSVVYVSDLPETLAALEESCQPAAFPFDLVVVDLASAGEEGMLAVARDLSLRQGECPPVLGMVPPERIGEMSGRREEFGLNVVIASPARPSVMLDAIVRSLARPGSSPEEATGHQPAPALPEPVAEEAALAEEGPWDPDRLGEEAAKLERMLIRNSLDAKRQFAVLRTGLPGTRYAGELKALELCLERLDFKKARQLLAQLPVQPCDPDSEGKEPA
ncbi:PAS domain S-box protein [Geomonas sp. Red32]|uniref:PAS domain S-box protein n=1 Tax=Geomonas sp. Red32 TaxID=2912856 RepID=UPI00202CFC87|nr:PAS domain S-box protein [Geomonas sp. Red32]MCM0081873.1 PAS domain S-box protein [Geomonas sp. Red32]